jgi:hypothetical protein
MPALPASAHIGADRKTSPIEIIMACEAGRISVGSGASRARTGDLLGAIQALSQLSYSPAVGEV